MSVFLDICEQQFNKHGEELCGDSVRVRRLADRTILVLSDGLGSGVKASILSTLTAEILVKMLAESVPLDEVIATVIGTLPVCKVRQLAYATFTVVQILHEDYRFRVVNFDNPRIIWLKDGRLLVPPRQSRKVMEREIYFFEGRLEPGDVLLLLSDGVLHAGIGRTMNPGWGWENVGQFVQAAVRSSRDAQSLARQVMNKTWSLYGGEPGDDATLVAMTARRRNSLMIFTGPPVDRGFDVVAVESLLKFPGRKVVCGGTTSNIVAGYLDEAPEMDLATMRPEVPPAARLREVDLVTEGILTLSRALGLLGESGLRGDLLPDDNNAAVLLAREICRADDIHFLVGQSVNEFYQNPDLPRNLSLRKNLVDDLVRLLKSAGREVVVKYC